MPFQETVWTLSELLHSGLEVRLRLARDSTEVESWAVGSGEVSTGVKGRPLLTTFTETADFTSLIVELHLQSSVPEQLGFELLRSGTEL